MTRETKVVILGGGPAGLGAAFWLSQRGFRPVLVEAQRRLGGNAGSFEIDGMRVDFGSHRLHPSTDPEILKTLRGLLGPDLLIRPRHGRILLGSRWVHFPLKPFDLAVSAPPSFLLRAFRDALISLVPGRRSNSTRGRLASREAGGLDQATAPGRSFASVLETGLGPTICQSFYFPYARKIWGLDPDQISPVQADRRVGARSLFAILQRLLPGGIGRSHRGKKGVFYYPRRGFGQISESLSAAAQNQGATILLGSPVREIRLGPRGGGQIRIHGEEKDVAVQWDQLWSTLPLRTLVEMIEPSPPEEVLGAASALETRSMILVYLVLGSGRFSEFDAHYFPSEDIPFTRISEPKNYAAREEPRSRTVLCAEIPCSREEPIWIAREEALAELVIAGLAQAGLPIRAPVLRTVVRRLPAAYPVYRIGYERHFSVMDQWLEHLSGILTFGRQGLFAHDNTHHALAMARAAVECLGDEGHFDGELWSRHRQVFATHVVQD